MVMPEFSAKRWAFLGIKFGLKTRGMNQHDQTLTDQEPNQPKILPAQKMTRQMRRDMERKLEKIKIVPDKKIRLTANTGLGVVLEIFDQSPLKQEFIRCLPERVSHRSCGSYLLGLLILAGHLKGVDSLSSLRRVREDPYLEELFEDEVAAIRTLGDFLEDFEAEHLERLDLFLNTMAKSIHEHLSLVLPEEFKPKNFIVDIDSTHHVHYGDEIEGLAYNYKGEWCLESHTAFDSLGLCHGFQLRNGNTKPGTGAAEFIESIFRDHRQQRVRRLEGTDFFRADSAYCNQSVIKKCLELGIQFSITAHKATTQWTKNFEPAQLQWTDWEYSAKDLKKSRSKKLPKVQVARFYWQPSWADGVLKFPIVIKRTWMTFEKMSKKAKHGQRSLFELSTIKEEGDWQYYAVVTNIDLTKWTIQSVFEHHQKRAMAENHIKNAKYGMRLNNFPCFSLNKNQAWAQLSMVAHNMLRWLSLLDNPGEPGYAERTRGDWIFHPGKLASHARQIILRTTIEFKEVLKKIEGWQFPGFNSAQIFSTA